MKLELIATATFGLEAVVKREILELGYKILKTEDGKITYLGDERAVARSNLWLRCADRVLLKQGEFVSKDFESLFQQTKGIAWEELIPPDGKFTVIGSSVKSALHSVPACQSIVKKAVVERLKAFYGIEHFEETGAEYTIKITFLKDRATLTVDTSGKGLHKRGYRMRAVAAPLKETLAAAMVMLSFWKPGRILLDPCCGAGTIPIEAALIGLNIAPGLSRRFASERWELVPHAIWKEERRLACEAVNRDIDLDIIASDIDKEALQAAISNAEKAGVGNYIKFMRKDIKNLNVNGAYSSVEGGIVLTNPPYGERIGGAEQIEKIYAVLRKFLMNNKTWSMFLITPDKGFERALRRRADRRRKLFNGNIEATYYQFHGEKTRK